MTISTVAPSYQICVRCVMDTSDPLIRFDDGGVCNHCHDYDEAARRTRYSGRGGRQRFDEIVQRIKREGARKRYDCIIGVSGGVDSTFVAWKVKELGLRPLAVHLDNGWDSEIAVSNISKVLRKLDIDLHTHVIDWEEFKDIQRAFLFASTPDAEIPSDHAIFASLYATASRFRLRYVITGMNTRTETHLPISWSQGHLDWGYIRAVHRRFGTGRIKTFPHINFYQFFTGFGYTHERIDLLDYIDYSKMEALKFLREQLGWRDYGGKHHESIYTRWFQGCYLPRKFGYDKRRCHLSSLICSGEITRDKALTELEQPPYPIESQEQDCEYVRKKLGFTKESFDAIMTAPHRRYEDFPSYGKFLASPSYKMARRIFHFIRDCARTVTFRNRGEMITKNAIY